MRQRGGEAENKFNASTLGVIGVNAVPNVLGVGPYDFIVLLGWCMNIGPCAAAHGGASVSRKVGFVTVVRYGERAIGCRGGGWNHVV